MKFISSSYDEKSGISTVTMQHFGRKFIGTAKFCSDDPNPSSEFVGCRFAEFKATIAALKYEREIAKIKAKEASDFVKSCSCYKEFDSENPVAKLMERQLKKRQQRVEDITKEIEMFYKSIEETKKRRTEFYKKINDLKSKSDNQ